MATKTSSRSLISSLLFALFISAIVAVSGGLGVATVVGYQVFYGDDEALKKSTILARINEETTIYTLDGETRIGAFFDQSHRSYVAIDRVPAHMVRAMVASEDKNFYNHSGVDPIAISSAFWDGVRRGFRFRRGGSTITQQTVKNIMDRREHTFQRKFREMIRALQLERLYTKNEILEFYLNQFHVTANGNGIGIAAKYYFSKGVEDLDLVEAAFIAGSVKAPDKYNPFTKNTKKAKEKAWQRADERKNYVLRRMYEQGWIGKDELQSAWEIRVPFKKGSFTSKEVALVSLIKGQLNKKEILEAINLESIEELNQAGLKVYTTIDADLQKNAQLAMRRNLSRLEYILEDFKVEDPTRFKPLRNLEDEQFAFGKISHIAKGPKPYLEVDFGLPVGVVPMESLIRVAKILNLPTYKGHKFHLEDMLSKLKVGDVILTEVRSYDKESHRAELELRAYPKMNGGLIAVEKGEVRAVVSGFEAKGFNRAVFATRQPGSVFKSLTFLAALQLGWTVVDQLDNERRLFPFQGNFYYPRPDHPSPYESVSMVWAGVKSENIASIYLAANLLDKLNFGEFKKLLGRLNLLPEKDESVADYHFRVSKTVGVQLDSDGVKEHLLSSAVHDLKPDFVFSGKADLYRSLSKLWWGRNYLPELKNLYELDEEQVSVDERDRRVQMLFFNFERFNRLSEALSEDWSYMRQLIAEGGAESIFTQEEAALVLSRFRVQAGSTGAPKLAYSRFLPEEEEFIETNMADHEVVPSVTGRPLNALDVQMIWGQSESFGKANIHLGDINLAGVLPMKYLGRISSNLESRLGVVMAANDTYHLYRYFNHHDFRIVLGLNYLVSLSREMGVYSKLEPVLSYPLGTNVVSVAEVAKIYQSFVEGKTYRFYKEGPANQLNFIKRIEDRDGQTLFETEATEFQLFDSCVASQMSEILGKVVTHGTGRRARGELQIPLREADESKKIKEVNVRIPAYGKTGTTNDYTTAYFAGFIPYPTVHRAPLDVKDSMVIASYVGYDLNRMMKRGPYRISGAYGALPVWSDFGKALLDAKKYDEYVDKLDLSLYKKRVWPLSESSCGEKTRVDLARGTLLRAPTTSVAEVYKFTDIEREGEVLVNEFARNASVRSFVMLPKRNGLAKRSFTMYQTPPVEEEAPTQHLPPSEKDEDEAGGGLGESHLETLDEALPLEYEPAVRSLRNLRHTLRERREAQNAQNPEEQDTQSEDEIW